MHRSVINRELRGKKDITLGRVAELAWALGRTPELVLSPVAQPVGSNLPMPSQIAVGTDSTQRVFTMGGINKPQARAA